MDTIEHFSDFLRTLGAPNVLGIGIATIVLWLLISGLIRGIRRKGRGKPSKEDNDHQGDE